MKKTKERGITLIALAITIIVLLILAGISITSLISDNGILKQAQNAAEKNKIEEYRQELTLILLEGQLENYDSDNSALKNSVKTKIIATGKYNIIDEEEMEDYIIVETKTEGYKYKVTLTEVIYLEQVEVNEEEQSEEITYTITYAGLEGATLSTENPTNYTATSENFTLNNPTKNGYIFVGWTGTDLTETTKEVTIPTGSIGDRSFTATWTDVIQYASGKTFNTITTGEKITIDGEEFTVISKTSTQIMAMPKWNITLSTTNPIQSSSAETLAFADTGNNYWEINTEATGVYVVINSGHIDSNNWTFYYSCDYYGVRPIIIISNS